MCSEIENLSAMSDAPESLDAVLILIFEAVSKGIVQVDFEAHSVFIMVHEKTRQELVAQ
jgi:hypothetical protein